MGRDTTGGKNVANMHLYQFFLLLVPMGSSALKQKRCCLVNWVQVWEQSVGTEHKIECCAVCFKICNSGLFATIQEGTLKISLFGKF